MYVYTYYSMVTGLNRSTIKAKKIIYEIFLKIYICCGCRHTQYKIDIGFNIILDVDIHNTNMIYVLTLLRISTSTIQSRWNYYGQKF